ncbi:TadE/TadG family type IV pilus assembly protein [Streptomyces sp. SCSIO 30461]|uniref:TadE/TadG family type IV pilus assembly protein n=1 Tax=Streptomyces sp. SCSIO 30461 TaxID=3118085 RepID=UPI0030D461C9
MTGLGSQWPRSDRLRGRSRARGQGRLLGRLLGGFQGRLQGRFRDRGQTAIEFLGVTPLIILLLVVLWQCALIGYTYSLAGNAADQAARAGAVSEDGAGQRACQEAAREDLPTAWVANMEDTGCDAGTGLFTATVVFQVPALVPGVLDFPMRVTGKASAVREH